MKYNITFLSDKGMIRSKNEDNGYINGLYRSYDNLSSWQFRDICFNNLLVAVFDGVGGEKGGEIASRIAAEDMKSYDNGIFSEKIEEYVYETKFLISTNPKFKMATTYAVLSIEENEFCFSNIGDSKGYLLRDHKLQKKTKDHSIIQNLIDEGILTEKEARKHPQKHMIYQALGMQEEDMDPEPYITLKEKVQQGDKFILCTDGVTDMVSDKDIEQIMLSEESKLKIKEIFDKAMKNGGKDNITILLVETE